jgi:hypothetical protein
MRTRTARCSVPGECTAGVETADRYVALVLGRRQARSCLGLYCDSFVRLCLNLNSNLTAYSRGSAPAGDLVPTLFLERNGSLAGPSVVVSVLTVIESLLQQ